MRGIIVDDLDTLIKNSSLNLDEVRQKIIDLRSAYFDLKKKIRSSELDFLTKNLYEEINQLGNVLKKINAYQILLNDVLKSYKNREYVVSMNIKKEARQIN